ncbi:unnamed protein product (macronuclear) [Paramecium tetraurelia]|uniref:Cysteine protease n=1 Tax=Paramecium tetraurelia TaxID=5888 RepID=Q6BFR3_PARTE|nr:Cysteine protease required for autophagy-like [Paramecium tetraurelia strain d4-2]XP_001423152.1 uncharacterized protein GSPATT00000189001 [Paramecium tetraurelia]CAH03507.1 Cysteine protease required for autophagy-like [Paramecium tetraurelia]CAK55754.1 unnamed protein product [Paramecium tetraurelia]|eukprot:XP_001423152.1 hypothetical protein (macronuclear) [Paramecium tetraurelia strain d4-2]
MYIFGQEIQNVDSFLQLKETFIWFSYRANIQYEGRAISDQGWGCLIRVGQMIVANSLIRESTNSKPNDLKTKIICLFDDNQCFSTLAPFSIQQIIKRADLVYNIKIGDWYTGPKIMCLLEDLLQSAKTIKQLKIINFLEQCVIEKQIDLQFKQPQLLIIHAIIGNKELDQYFVAELQKHMQIPQFAGAIVGKSKKAYFLIGYQNNQGIVMDPHYVQESNLLQLNSQLKCIPLKEFSGTIALCYYISNSYDYQQLKTNLKDLKGSIFSIIDETCTCFF